MFIPKGTNLLFNTRAISISSFEDGERFLPERWIDDSSKLK